MFLEKSKSLSVWIRNPRWASFTMYRVVPFTSSVNMTTIQRCPVTSTGLDALPFLWKDGLLSETWMTPDLAEQMSFISVVLQLML